MRNELKKVLFMLLAFSASLFLHGQSSKEDLVEQELSWADVEGAWGYEVIIRQGTEEILRRQTESSKLIFSLNPGEYEFSIAVLNKFKKNVSTTPWKPLIIKEAFQPVVRRFTPEEVFEQPGGNLTIQAEVYQVQDDTAFFLSAEDGTQIEGRQMQLNKESVRLKFPMRNLTPGTYTLSAVDSSGLSDTSDVTVLKVLEVMEPKIRSVNEKRLVQKEVYPDITVKGEGFKEDATARVYFGDQTIIPYEIEWISPERLRIALITGEAAPGRYDLEVTNPSGTKARKRNAFIIEKAPLTEIIQEVPPPDSTSVLGGYTYAISTDSDNENLDTVPLGFALKLRQDIVNRIFWRVPGLRPLGLEFHIDYTTMRYDAAEYYYSQLYTGFHFYYKIPLLRGWSLMPRLGAGVSNLWVHEKGMSGSIVQGDFGHAFTAALGAQKKYKNDALLEFGFDLRSSTYSGNELSALYPWIIGGYQF
jgi:hypothetical protein